MSRVTDREDWFEVWWSDKQSIIETMTRNMAADLSAGYDYFGKSIRQERAELEAYKKKIDDQMDEFKSMDEQAVNRWCYYELKKTGAIA